MSKKILILSEAIGSGHTKAAEALVQGISYLSPTIEIKTLEASHLLHPVATKIMVQVYLKMILFLPAVWRKIYQYHQNKPLAKWKQEFIHLLFYRKIESILEQERPHLVICTHSFSSVTMSRLKRQGYPITLCVAITDFHVHGVWVHPEVDLYLVAYDNIAHQLERMGIDKRKIIVTGMPSRSDFWNGKNKKEIKMRFQLNHLPTVMVMGGGLGLGGIQKIAHHLLKWKDRIQIVICTGSNRKLREAFRRNKNFHHPNIRILGFVEQISEWMEVTDLLITKSGGLTCFEALLKGVPLCIYQPISGHEEKNCEFLVSNELAIQIDDSSQIDQWIEKLCISPQPFAHLYKNINQFQQKVDPLASAKSITQLLDQETTRCDPLFEPVVIT